MFKCSIEGFIEGILASGLVHQRTTNEDSIWENTHYLMKLKLIIQHWWIEGEELIIDYFLHVPIDLVVFPLLKDNTLVKKVDIFTVYVNIIRGNKSFFAWLVKAKWEFV